MKMVGCLKNRHDNDDNDDEDEDEDDDDDDSQIPDKGASHGKGGSHPEHSEKEKGEDAHLNIHPVDKSNTLCDTS